MTNYGKWQNYMTHNPPSIDGYTIVSTFKSKNEALFELRDLRDHYKKGMLKPFYNGWVVYEKL